MMNDPTTEKPESKVRVAPRMIKADVDRILTSPATHHTVHRMLACAIGKDPLDAAKDAELVAAILDYRYRAHLAQWVQGPMKGPGYGVGNTDMI